MQITKSALSAVISPGANDKFLSGLAAHLASKKIILTNVSPYGKMLMHLEYITPKRGKLKAMQKV